MLTARQKAIFDYILEFRRSNGCSPSIPEIQKEFLIRSPNGVAGHLLALEAKGVIRRSRRGSRRIDVVEPLAPLRAPTHDLPLFREAPTGEPEGCVTIDEKTLGFQPGEGAFAMRVRGSAMRRAGILDGDIVIVQPEGGPGSGTSYRARTVIRSLGRKRAIALCPPPGASLNP